MRAFTFFDLAFIGGVSFYEPACNPGLGADAGGTTFDCYLDGDYTNGGFLPSGVGLTDYFAGDSPFGFAFGDEFSDYADGAYAGGSPGASATGYTTIYVGDGP